MLVSNFYGIICVSLTFSDNPNVQWEKVTCPEALSFVSGCRRDDDPVPGEPTPTPTRTTSILPIASSTVPQGGQCGGRRYSGPTVCVSGTVCTFVGVKGNREWYCPEPYANKSARRYPRTPTIVFQTQREPVALRPPRRRPQCPP